MSYLLDTDICSYVMKQPDSSLAQRLYDDEDKAIGISVITCAELMFGVERLDSRRLRLALNALLEGLKIYPWETKAARYYVRLRIGLESGGTPIGMADTMIAAHALALKSTLVTNNEKHFRRIPGLKVENWL